VTIARSAPDAHCAVTARCSDYRRESSTCLVQCSRFALQLPELAGSGPVLCGFPSLHLTLADLTRNQRPPLLRFSLLCGSLPLSFVSQARETPLFGFAALWHHLKQLIQSGDFQASDSSTSSVSHRSCELLCIINRPVPRLISSRKHLWAFLFRGFPSNNGPRALTRFIPSCCYGEGGHLVCFRVP